MRHLTLIRPLVVKGKENPITDFQRKFVNRAIQKIFLVSKILATETCLHQTPTEVQ